MKTNWFLTFFCLLKNKNSLSCILVLTLLLSCEEKYDAYEQRILDIIGEPYKDYNQITIIPGEGCGGCISGATFFVKENINKLDKVAIIFTGVQDKKLLNNQLGIDFLNKKQVYIDNNNLLMNKEVLSIYPYIIDINKSQLIKKTDFSEELIKMN